MASSWWHHQMGTFSAQNNRNTGDFRRHCVQYVLCEKSHFCIQENVFEVCLCANLLYIYYSIKLCRNTFLGWLEFLSYSWKMLCGSIYALGVWKYFSLHKALPEFFLVSPQTLRLSAVKWQDLLGPTSSNFHDVIGKTKISCYSSGGYQDNYLWGRRR